MNVRLKIFLLLSLVFLGSLMLYVRVYSQMDYQRIMGDLKAQAKQVEATFKNNQNATEMHMLQIATFVAHDPKVKQLFLLGKKAVELEGGGAGGELAAQVRNSLYEHLRQSQEILTEQFDFRQLHFHFGPGSLSFLRVHRPDKFGDRMDTVRHTIVSANAEQKNTMGFETGRVFSGIRGVTPVYTVDRGTQEKVHIGALEAGTSFSNMLSLFHNSRPWINVAVLLSREHLQANIWPDVLDKLLAETQFINNFQVEGTTSPEIEKILSRNDFSKILMSPGQHLLMDGEAHYNFISFPLRDFHGEIDPEVPDAGLVVTWQDISHQMTAYHNHVYRLIFYAVLLFLTIETLMFFALKQVTTQLQRELLKIQENKAETEQARLVAEESSRLKTEFLGNMSHELRTPMNAIMGLGKLLSESSLEPHQQNFIDKINLSSKSLLNLIEEILLISELEKRDINKSPQEIFNPTQLVNQVKGNFTSRAKIQGVELIANFPELLASRLKGYPIQLEQILSQLLGNAIKFSSGGHVILSLAILKSDKEAIELEFAVTDQGIGIAKEQQELIFQPFQQEDGSKTRTYGGTGLGLTIAQRICWQLGCDIRVDSTLGKGSRFSFTLTVETVADIVTSPLVSATQLRVNNSPPQLLGTIFEITQLLDQLEEPLTKLQPKQCLDIATKLNAKQWPEHLSEEIVKLAILISRYRFVEALEVATLLKNNLK